MNADELVRMANQIADFARPYGTDEGVRTVEEHIRAFWDPRMRRAMADHLAAGGAGLSDLARAGAERACGLVRGA
jgi:formate dehydrogenase subunit delta